MDMELLEGAACAASDLTARLQAELTQAKAQLAIGTARTHSILARGETIPPDLANDCILHAEQVAVLRELLDGLPSVAGDCHAACT
jgi:hypothetical protein